MGWVYQRTSKVKVGAEGLKELRLIYFDRAIGRITEDCSVEEAGRPYLREGVIGLARRLTGQEVVVSFEFQEEEATLVPMNYHQLAEGVDSFKILREEWGLKGRVLQIAIEYLCPTDGKGRRPKWEK